MSRPIIVEGTRATGLTRLAISFKASQEVTFVEHGRPRVFRRGLLHYDLEHEGKTLRVTAEPLGKITEDGDWQFLVSPQQYDPLVPVVFLDARVTSLADDADRYSQLDRENALKEMEGIRNALKILEPRLERLTVITEGPAKAIHGAIGGTASLLPLQVMGGGVVRLTRLLLAIYRSRGGIVLVDEIEDGFHHSVLTKVWQALELASKDADVQVFATTHSYECVQAAVAAFKEQNDEFGYCRLVRVHDRIKTVPYEAGLIEAAVEENAEVR